MCGIMSYELAFVICTSSIADVGSYDCCCLLVKGVDAISIYLLKCFKFAIKADIPFFGWIAIVSNLYLFNKGKMFWQIFDGRLKLFKDAVSLVNFNLFFEFEHYNMVYHMAF